MKDLNEKALLDAKKTEEKFCCLGKKSLTLQRETIVLY